MREAIWGLYKDGVTKAIGSPYARIPEDLGTGVAKFIQDLSDKELVAFFDKLTALPEGIDDLDFMDEMTDEDRDQFVAPFIAAMEGRTHVTSDNRRIELWTPKMYQEGYYHYEARHVNGLYDSMLADYAYLINLDEHMLEFYIGEQFVGQKNRYTGEEHDRPYKNMRLMVKVRFEDIRDVRSDLVGEWLGEYVHIEGLVHANHDVAVKERDW